MKLIFLILAGLTAWPLRVDAEQSPNSGFVVVELFSSEGCSDCPSAERLNNKLTQWARKNNEPVYPLNFHVDYWNYLGWRDVFSRPEFAQRQNMYATIFKDQGVYTPQMIVNGMDAFVGSDQPHLQRDLNRELTVASDVSLEMSLSQQASQVIVTIKAQGFSNGDLINAAIVERGLSVTVTAGENEGRTLYHDNVVREFQTRKLKQGPMQLQLPLGKVADLSNASVIAFVQNPQTMLITAAKQLDLEND